MSQVLASEWRSVPGGQGEGQVLWLKALIDSCCEGDDVLVEVAVGCRGLGREDVEGAVGHDEELHLRVAELT